MKRDSVFDSEVSDSDKEIKARRRGETTYLGYYLCVTRDGLAQ